jgi:hypothetical protein
VGKRETSVKASQLWHNVEDKPTDFVAKVGKRKINMLAEIKLKMLERRVGRLSQLYNEFQIKNLKEEEGMKECFTP